MYKNFHIAVGALIIKRNKVLLNHRTDYDMWNLPSGGMEKGETIFQALKREVKEETGLNIEPVKLTGVYQNYKREIIVFNFLVKVLSGKLTKNREADAFKYFDYKKLPKNFPDKQKERIFDYFSNKKKVFVKIQKSVPSLIKLGFKN
jgi:ADP-ribose pyrophosphatase YjhB (NUDIX family)